MAYNVANDATKQYHTSAAVLHRGLPLTLGDYLRSVSDAPASSRPALVVEGGGLRGIYSLAALGVLEDLGLRDAFSFVIGSSAGAINGAYFLAGRARDSVDIYSGDLASRRFVCPPRFWRIVDIDYMIDVALKQHHPFDASALHAAGPELLTVLTDAETAEQHVIASSEFSGDWYELFRATAALPALYGKRIGVGAGKYVDGGIANQVPIDEAFARGASEAIVIVTRGQGYRRQDKGRAFRWLARLASLRQSPLLRAKIGVADERYNAAMDMLEEEEKEVPRRTWTVRPHDPARLVGRTTSDRELLLDCAAMGREDMLAVLAAEVPMRTKDSV